MDASVDEVCRFLQDRQVPVEVVERFRENKINPKVVAEMSDEQLSSLGLIAIGDVVLLRSHCRHFRSHAENGGSLATLQPKEKLSRDKRSKILKRLLDNDEFQQTAIETPNTSRRSTAKKGRPRSDTKTIYAGLRLEKENHPKGFQQIRHPLRDNMIISLSVNYDIKYDDLLEELKTTFFPDGQSPCPIVGAFDQYNFAVVNVANNIITEDFGENFTLWNYLMKHKATTGRVRFHLLCMENDTVEIVESSAEEDPATMDSHAGLLLVQENAENTAASDSQTGPSPVHDKAEATDSQTQPSSVQENAAVTTENAARADSYNVRTSDVDTSTASGSMERRYIDATSSGEVQFTLPSDTSFQWDLYGNKDVTSTPLQMTNEVSNSDEEFLQSLLPLVSTAGSQNLSTSIANQQDRPSVLLENGNSVESDRIKAEVESALMQLHDLIDVNTIDVKVHRDMLLEELIDMYRQNGREMSSMNVSYVGEVGDDFGGLTKDLLTTFWLKAIERYFKGDAAVVPFLPLHELRKHKQDYIPLGRILAHTVALTKSTPSRLCRSFLLALVFGGEGVSDEIAVRDFELYITNQERTLIDRARRNFASLSQHDLDDLLSMYSMFGFLEEPKAAEFEDQIKTIARSELVDKPATLVQLVRNGIPASHMDVFWNMLTVPMIEHLFECQMPTPSKVIGVLKVEKDYLEPVEEQTLYLLKQFLSNLDVDDLCTFLLFVTGSIVQPQKITISFTKLHGIERRPIAHTCSNTLDLPITYTSYQDMKREFRSVLENSDSFRMNAI